MDLIATRLGRWTTLGEHSVEDQANSVLGFMGHMAWMLGASTNANPLWNEKAASFYLRLIGLVCQQRLVELLSRREVLLRLMGAERMTASTICLLLKGVAFACSTSTSANPIAEFMTAVAPAPCFCVLVVAVRTQAVILGTTLAITPRLMQSGALGVPMSFALGLFGGAYAAKAVLCVWYENHEDLDSPPLRLALLVPGVVSGKAKGLLTNAITGARKRAVKMMAKGFLHQIIRWCFPALALTK
jgi:hypothetical protein